MKPKQLPQRKEINRQHPMVFRSNDDVLDIYNAHSGAKEAKALSKAVLTWVKAKAEEASLEAYEVLAYPSKTKKAGLIWVRKGALKQSE